MARILQPSQEALVSVSHRTDRTPAPAKVIRKRGKGLIKAMYENNGVHEASAKPIDPYRVTYSDGNGGSFSVEIDQIPAPVLHTLAAQSLFKHVETYARNHLANTPAIDSVEKRCKEILSGIVHTRVAGNGTKATRAVDVTPWVDAYALMLKNLKKPCPQESLDAYRDKLLNMSGVERNRFITAQKARHAHYRQACLTIAMEMAKAKTKAIKEEVNLEDFLA